MAMLTRLRDDVADRAAAAAATGPAPLAAVLAALAARLSGTADRHLRAGDAWRRIHLHGAAARAYARAARAGADDVDVLRRLAEAERRRGRFAAAAAVLDRALAGDPANADLQRRRDDMELVRTARPLGRRAKVRAIEGDRLRDAGRLAAAAEAFAAVVALAPDYAIYRVQHGNMLADLGDLAGAEAAYRGAIAVAPGAAEPRLRLGGLLEAMGRRGEAVACWADAVAAAPHHDGALRRLAGTPDPRHQEAWYMRRQDNGALAEALALAEEAAALRRRLAEIAARHPELDAEVGTPVGFFDLYRARHPPPPPPDDGGPVAALVRAGDVGLDRLHALLAAFAAQTKPDWILAVIGADAAARDTVARVALAEPRIRWVEADDAGTPDAVAAVVDAIGAAAGVLLLAPGAIPEPSAAAWLAHALSATGARAVVADAEAITAGGVRRPLFGTLPDRFSALERDIGQAAVLVGRALLDALVADRALFADPARSLAVLRRRAAFVAAVDATLAHVPLPLAALPDPPPADLPEALLWATAMAPPPGFAVGPPQDGRRRAAAAAFDPDEPMAVIVPTRDNAGDLVPFVRSLRARADRPAALEILVLANGGTRPETVEALAALAAAGEAKVLPADGPFNWSALNNRAVAACTAPLLVFANDDMTMLTDGWDGVLRGLLARPEVGAVGAHLLYPDGTLQHAGVLTGWHGGTIHDGLHEAADAPGPSGRRRSTRAVATVTGAFLALRRERFLAVGGFDDRALPVAYSDVDLCLKLRAEDLLILVTPDVRLHHHESKSRGQEHESAEKLARFRAEQAVMARRWGAAMTGDPSVAPHWVMDLVPFRLLQAPDPDALSAYVARSAARPWRTVRAP